MDVSDCSMMNTSLAETSALPGSFPNSNLPIRAPQQENPPHIQEADISFMPYHTNLQQQQLQRTPQRDRKFLLQNDVLPRSPSFSFKSQKPVYPSLGGDDIENGRPFEFNFENDVLKKRFSQKLSDKVLQELNMRIENEPTANKLKRNLFSPRSQIRKQVTDKKLLSPRSQVHTGFNMVHNRHFNKMDSIDDHYSVHQQSKLAEEERLLQQAREEEERANLQRAEIFRKRQEAQRRENGSKIVRKKRRTLLGPEEIMEDVQAANLNRRFHEKESEQQHRNEISKTFRVPTLDPRRRADDPFIVRERPTIDQRIREPRVPKERAIERKIREPSVQRERPLAQATRTLDPRRNALNRKPSSRDLQQREFSTSSPTRNSSVRYTPGLHAAQSTPDQQRSSSIPVLNKKASFLKPTAASLSKSTSTYDVPSQRAEIRRSTTTVFHKQPQPAPPPAKSQMTRSSTFGSNLKLNGLSRVTHSKTVQNLSSITSTIPLNSVNHEHGRFSDSSSFHTNLHTSAIPLNSVNHEHGRISNSSSFHTNLHKMTNDAINKPVWR